MSDNGNRGVSHTGRALVLRPFVVNGGSALDPAERLDEAVGLAQAIDLEIVHSQSLRLGRIRPSTFLGKGIVDELTGLIEALEVVLVVVDTALTPIQQRNLEKAWNAKVIDRTGLILEIFGARATTREGSLQVELAALTYQRSRLVRSWTHLERQRGGLGFIGGPGERQLEIDRRLIGKRIARLRRDLEEVKRTRALHRTARGRVPFPVVAMVGYTNAGKSTLFNRLTKAGVVAKDMLFATLDPTMRSLDLPSGRTVVLSDTVGFISDLPTQLVAAFQATLEEVVEADVILHVRDIAHSGSETQKREVESVLAELGLEQSRPLEVLNKIDLLDAEARELVLNRAARGADKVAVSSISGEGCENLLLALDKRLSENRHLVDIEVDLSDGAALSWLYRHGEILERQDEGMSAHIVVALDAEDEARYRNRFQVRDS